MGLDSNASASPTESTSAFATTQWTRVLAARGNSQEAKAALSELCGTYYAPVVTFLRCSGIEEDGARELAHEFFARLLGGSGFEQVERGRGRFRSYVLGAVKHFVADARDRKRTAKRGGQIEHVALEPGTDATPGLNVPDTRARTPEHEFDRQWAFTILDRALQQLEKENQSDGQQEKFDALKPWLTGDVPSASQAEMAERLSMNEGAVKVAIHRLRKRFRELVKGEIAQTVSDPAQVNEELRSLIAALR